MNTTIIGVIALLTLAWTLFIQRIDSPGADTVALTESPIVDENVGRGRHDGSSDATRASTTRSCCASVIPG